MNCKKCGAANQENAKYCRICGESLKENKNQKNMILAFVISFFFAGIGIAYAGKTKRAMIIFLICLIFYILSKQRPIFAVVAVVIWCYGLYETYNQVRIANGDENPNILEDWKRYPTSKKVLSLILVIVVLLIVGVTVAFALTPVEIDDFNETNSTEEMPLNEDVNDTIDEKDILPVDEVDSEHHINETEEFSQLEFDDNQINSFLNGYNELPDNIHTDGKTYVFYN